LPMVSARQIAVKTANFIREGARITNLGVSFAGPVNADGVVIKSPNIFGATLENIPYAQYLSNVTGLKTGVANDMVAAGFGQMRWGTAKGLDNFLVVTVSSGIGANAFLNRQPIIGQNGMAGEIGHMPVFRPEEAARAHEFYCACGKWGHLEAISSGNNAAVVALNKAINFYMRNDFRIKDSNVLMSLRSKAFELAQVIANNGSGSEEARKSVNVEVGKGYSRGDWFTKEVYGTVIPPVAHALVLADIKYDMDKVVLVGSYGLKMPGYVEVLNNVLKTHLNNTGFGFKSNDGFAKNFVIKGVDMRAEKAAATIPWQVSPE